MQRADFEFELPPELIAQEPLAERSASRLLHLDGATGALRHLQFRDLPGLLEAGDLLVMNDTRVMQARLAARRATGGRIELLVERVLTPERAWCHARPARALAAGQSIWIANGIEARSLGRTVTGLVELELVTPHDWDAVMAQHGALPLPPYIERAPTEADASRYQTLHARHPGAVAAPTAGLHFDAPVLDALAAAGVNVAWVTLHVGAGTFQPLREADVTRHRMHSERYVVPEATVAAVAAARSGGRRVIAVGTTSLRALESAGASGELSATAGETDIYITPGYRFRIIDALITNFHLPGSTLILLVAALAGREHILEAYAAAIDQRYRFFSYGDAMFITPHPEATRAL